MRCPWLYTEARAANPARWSRQIRNWSPVGDVCLNPERDTNDRKIRDAA
jgi:putative transposase